MYDPAHKFFAAREPEAGPRNYLRSIYLRVARHIVANATPRINERIHRGVKRLINRVRAFVIIVANVYLIGDRLFVERVGLIILGKRLI